jgi:hypothetical protein
MGGRAGREAAGGKPKGFPRATPAQAGGAMGSTPVTRSTEASRPQLCVKRNKWTSASPRVIMAPASSHILYFTD